MLPDAGARSPAVVLPARPVWVGIEMDEGNAGGVAVRGVVPDAPAARAGLVAGDEVLAIDDEPVRTPAALRDAISQRSEGKKLRLSVRSSAGVLRQVTLAPEARPDEGAMLRRRLVGQPAPVFSLARINAASGEPRETVARHRGHPLLIDFWATWCGPCVRALPELARLRARHAADGLAVVGISTESASVLAPAITELGIGHPILVDDTKDVSRAYGVSALPTLVLVDATGVVRDVELGGNLPAIEAALKALAAPDAGKPAK